jgi:hypothetical protein
MKVWEASRSVAETDRSLFRFENSELLSYLKTQSIAFVYIQLMLVASGFGGYVRVVVWENKKVWTDSP